MTAYSIWNDKHGIRLTGYCGQKASFSRTINVKVSRLSRYTNLPVGALTNTRTRQQIGHAVLHIDAYNEDYLITLPSLHIEGLITGSPYVELNRQSYITSSSGYTAKIDYSGRGWISGKKNSFTASLYPHDKTEKDAIYTIDGQWTESFTIKKKKDTVETYNAQTNKTTPLTLASVEEQDELESRRAWQKVAVAIQAGDMDTTGREKSIIENRQREMRRVEREEGREWERRYFSRTDEFPVFEKLAARIQEPVEADKTNGVWKFDADKAAKYLPKTTAPSS